MPPGTTNLPDANSKKRLVGRERRGELAVLAGLRLVGAALEAALRDRAGVLARTASRRPRSRRRCARRTRRSSARRRARAGARPSRSSSRIASPETGCAAVRKARKGRSARGRSGNAVSVIRLMRTSRDEVRERGRRRGRRRRTPALGHGGRRSGGGAARRRGFLPPRISPFRTDGTSVRSSSLRTAERAMPPKIATIGFQMPRPLNFRSVIPFGDSNSSDSIETFGRSPLPRTISRPFGDAEVHLRDDAVDGLRRDARARRALHLEGVLRDRRNAARQQVRLDVEVPVLDEGARDGRASRRRSEAGAGAGTGAGSGADWDPGRRPGDEEEREQKRGPVAASVSIMPPTPRRGNGRL